jgi:hypothetical protein
MNLEKDKLENEAWQVKRHNKKTIKELMTNLNEWLFDNFLNYFKQNEPNMKRLLDIPEQKKNRITRNRSYGQRSYTNVFRIK